MSNSALTKTLTRLPRYRRVDSPLELRISPARHSILAALGRYDHLVARQINCLLARSPASLTSTQEHLKLLFHAGYIQRLWLPTITPMGSSMAIYCLDNQGYQYLSHAGLEPSGRFRASELVQREFAFLRHHLQAIDLLVLAERLAQRYQQVSLARMRTERQLRQEPILLGSGNSRVRVVPDGWVDLRVGQLQHCLAFELDRGTERKNKIQSKVKHLLECSGAPYQQAFGTTSLTVAWVVAQGGDGRVEELVRWTEEVLRNAGITHEADLFRFAAFDPAEIEPGRAFFGAFWRRPFDERLLPLIGEDNGGA